MVETIKNYLRLLRIKQWIKNLFIFVPVFFSAHFFDPTYLIQSFIGFFCFSFVSSAIYIFNDWNDVEDDRIHPLKKYRPLAAGLIKPKNAILVSIFLLLLSFAINTIFIGGLISQLILILYVTQNILYSVKLKRIAIVDISIISLGFVFRLLYGGIINQIELSEWIILMTFLLSLFLAFSKRRNDVIHFDRTGVKTRRAIAGYNMEFIDISLSITSSILIIAYLMYTTSEPIILKFGKEIYLTSFFVIISILRYLKLSIVENRSADPTRLIYKDLFLQLLILGWLITFSFILYF